MSKPVISKEQQKKIALERIEQLFREAEAAFSQNKALANRYVSLARKISMKIKVKIPLTFKRRFCKHCYKYLQPNVNSRVRISKSKVIISCFECKKFTRIPLSAKRRT